MLFGAYHLDLSRLEQKKTVEVVAVLVGRPKSVFLHEVLPERLDARFFENKGVLPEYFKLDLVELDLDFVLLCHFLDWHRKSLLNLSILLIQHLEYAHGLLKV